MFLFNVFYLHPISNDNSLLPNDLLLSLQILPVHLLRRNSIWQFQISFQCFKIQLSKFFNFFSISNIHKHSKKRVTNNIILFFIFPHTFVVSYIYTICINKKNITQLTMLYFFSTIFPNLYM